MNYLLLTASLLWHSSDVTGTFEERHISLLCSFVNHDFLVNSISFFLTWFKIPSLNRMELRTDAKGADGFVTWPALHYDGIQKK